jgi:drug/metabolite transporter (DMT)-like permease
MKSNVLALSAIALWAALALLGIKLAHVPPFLLTGLSLLIGGLLALPWMWRAGRLDMLAWQQALRSPRELALGVYGLFGFHALLFIALRTAPPVQANLVNYLWPLLMVVLAPLLLPGVRLTARHLLAAALGFAGAALAISSGGPLSGGFALGYLFAAASAFVWASYSLLSKRLAMQGKALETAAIGLYALISGLLSVLCHALFEPRVALTAGDGLFLALLGIGPMGAAFYLWDMALKTGDARQIGVLSYITPVASSMALVLAIGQPITLGLGAAVALIVGAAWLGTRA